MNEYHVQWGESIVKLSFEQVLVLPPKHLITSAHGFCFYEGKLLMVDLNHRGWDFPGGHIEQNETPEQCFKREALEEGYVEGHCTLFGAIKVDHSDNPMWKEGSRYPKIGYQVFYKMDITKFHPFLAEHESSRRQLVDPSEASKYHKGWNPVFEYMIQATIEQEQK
jgi:8-oxo-dGTP diphosphatase